MPSRTKKRQSKPKTLTVNQTQLNHIFAAGRAALKKTTRTVTDNAVIRRFKQFAPEGEAQRIEAKFRKKRKPRR